MCFVDIVVSVIWLVLLFFNCLRFCFFCTELKGGWNIFRYNETFDLSLSSVKDTCERIDYNLVDETTFIEKYEKPCRPVVIFDGQLDWPAYKKWTNEVSEKIIWK